MKFLVATHLGLEIVCLVLGCLGTLSIERDSLALQNALGILTQKHMILGVIGESDCIQLTRVSIVALGGDLRGVLLNGE